MNAKQRGIQKEQKTTFSQKIGSHIRQGRKVFWTLCLVAILPGQAQNNFYQFDNLPQPVAISDNIIGPDNQTINTGCIGNETAFLQRGNQTLLSAQRVRCDQGPFLINFPTSPPFYVWFFNTLAGNIRYITYNASHQGVESEVFEQTQKIYAGGISKTFLSPNLSCRGSFYYNTCPF